MNKELPIAYRLWKNEARRLLRKVLNELTDSSEGSLLLTDNWKQDNPQFKGNYYPHTKEGKLLNEIDNFLNTKSSLTDT